MKRICDQAASQKRLAGNTLLWITCAKRPLTPLELRTALAVEVGDRELDQENLPDLEDIISTCAGLVTVRSDGSGEVIEMAHYTMKEFFTRSWTVWFPLAHESIATTCLTYLSFDAFQGGMCFNDTEFEARLGQYPLYSYAARNWGHHARVQHVNNDLIFSFLTDTLKVNASVQALFALRGLSNIGHYCRRIPFQFTPFHLAIHFGLENTVRLTIENRDQVYVRDSMNRNSMAWVAVAGHDSVVKMLLNYEAEASGRDDNGSMGWIEVVKLLLGKGIDPDSRDIDDQTPLSWASYRGHNKVVQLLLSWGADPNSKDDYGKTPAMWAASDGWVEIFRSLLNYSAHVNCKYEHGKTAFSYSTEGGHLPVARLLQEKSAHSDLIAAEAQLPVLWEPLPDNAPVIPICNSPLLPSDVWRMAESNAEPPKPEYKCPLCEAGQRQVFRIRGTFKRHIVNHHYPDSIYICPHPACGRSFLRRDQFCQHHSGTHGTRPSLHEEYKQSRPLPPSCVVCQRSVNSWNEFYMCILEHDEAL